MIKRTINEPGYDILAHVLIVLPSNKGSGEPAQMRRLASVFVARIHKVCM